MFSLFRSQTELIRQLKGLDEERQHDRFNIRKPGVNYDKFPRPIRPRKSITNCSERSLPMGVIGDEYTPFGCSSERASRRRRKPLSPNGNGTDETGDNGGAMTTSLCGLSALARVAGYEGDTDGNGTNQGNNAAVAQDQLQSIAFAFSHLHMEAGAKKNREKSSTLPSIRRHYARYDYTALEDDQSVPADKVEMDKKHHRGTARGNALLTCQYYLRTSGRYTYMEQLNDIGSRIDKYWFMVRDTNLKTDRMLTLVPYSEYSPISFNGSTKDILTDLFLALQHPYIYPILDVDFKTLAEETFVINIYPFNCHGSLKDLIYRSICRDDWQEKYGHRSVGLPEPQIQRIGRQILEALLFLRDKGFPPFGHLHSGNVIMQNGVARLTGFENTLLGYTSRIYPVLRKRLRDCKDAIDTICFGHVLFEMAAAYELNVVHPTTKHLQDVQSCPQILQVLNYIFDREDTKYPTIEEISLLDFFRNLDLREMRGAASPPIFQAKLSPAVRCLLRDVRRHQKCQKTSKRSHSTSSLETPRELKSFPGSNILDNKEGVGGIHRNLSASYAASSNCLVVLENGDIRHQAQMMSSESTKSTPYCSLLDVSGHLMMPSGGGGSEEYHTPPTTPTIKSELDLSNHNDNNNHHQLHELATLAPSSLLQHCFQKIQNTFEAVHKASHSNRDSII